MDQLDERGFGLAELLEEFLVEGLALVDRRLVGFEYPCSHSDHQLHNLFKLDHVPFVLLPHHPLLLLQLALHPLHLGHFRLVLQELVLDEQLVLLQPPPQDDLAVVLQQLKMQIFPRLYVS